MTKLHDNEKVRLIKVNKYSENIKEKPKLPAHQIFVLFFFLFIYCNMSKDIIIYPSSILLTAIFYRVFNLHCEIISPLSEATKKNIQQNKYISNAYLFDIDVNDAVAEPSRFIINEEIHIFFLSCFLSAMLI